MEQGIKKHNKVGEFIRESRNCRKLTQEQLAAQLQVLGCNMTRGTLAKIEAGIRNVSFDELRFLRRVLSIDLNDMFK